MMRRFIDWLWSRLPCLHDYEHRIRGGWWTGPGCGHENVCKKCGHVEVCRCEVCAQPWRDW